MPPVHRRTATRVVGGRAMRKNNWRRDRGDYHVWPQAEIRLDRRAPGRGFRHLVTIAQLRAVVELLPAWDTIAVGLDAVVLDSGQHDVMGWQRAGVVAVCAWEQELWWEDCDPAFAREHRAIFELLGVEEARVDGRLEVRWTEAQARAFQLMHILPHELGHHRDRMTTRSRRASRGEPFAERYALQVMERTWPAYEERFGV
jgi:hypothetical protein